MQTEENMELQSHYLWLLCHIMCETATEKLATLKDCEMLPFFSQAFTTVKEREVSGNS